MSDEIEERRKLRTRFMRWVFEEASASQGTLVEAGEFVKVIDAQPDDFDIARRISDAIRYLEGQHLIKAAWTMGGLPSVRLTHQGIREMEEAISRPDRPTAHLAPISIIHVGGSIIGSNIQQGTSNSIQTASASADEAQHVRDFVAAGRAALANEPFDPALRPRASADLDAIESEITRPEPNWKVLRAIGQSARVVLESGLGGALTSALLAIPWPLG